VDRSPNGPPQGQALRHRLVTYLWWLIFLGAVAGWSVGNGGGGHLATRLDAALARTDSDRNRRGRSGICAVVARWNLKRCGVAGVQVTLPYARAVSGVAMPRRALACP